MSQVSAAERRKHWQSVLDRQAASGKPISVFCAEENVSVPSFYQWRKKLQNVNAATDVILPVRIVSTPSQVARPPQQIQLFTPSGFALRFDASIPTDTLQRLLASIEASVARGESC